MTLSSSRCIVLVQSNMRHQIKDSEGESRWGKSPRERGSSTASPLESYPIEVRSRVDGRSRPHVWRCVGRSGSLPLQRQSVRLIGGPPMARGSPIGDQRGWYHGVSATATSSLGVVVVFLFLQTFRWLASLLGIKVKEFLHAKSIICVYIISNARHLDIPDDEGR